MAAFRNQRSFCVGVLSCAVAIGCNRDGQVGDRQQPTVAIPAAKDAVDGHAPGAVSFTDAVITETDNPNLLPPPDRTLNGLSTGKLRGEVQRLWNTVEFTSQAGQPIVYSALLETERGTVTLRLMPEVAPNHVRNFVALARAGYYDGLLFEHVIQQEGDSGPIARLELVEGGCPLGTGEPGVGHLGYWLKPEFRESVKHEAGTVGACRDEQPDSAACRFYITLGPAPVMDGNFTVFATVTDGLDTIRTITKEPRPEGSVRPTTPVTIRKVTINARSDGP